MNDKLKKTSVGIALCRRNPINQIPEILLVQARLTYQFVSIVFGKYKQWDRERIMELLNNTTFDEKLLLASLDFDKMWYHVWLRVPKEDHADTFYKFYQNSKNKFYRLVSNDNGRKFKNMISRSKKKVLGWEIPKGRLEKNETEMDCAIREFKEETGISNQDYSIFYHEPPICNSYEDDNCIYVNKYFIAYCSKPVQPFWNFNNFSQVGEISDFAWIPIKQLSDIEHHNKVLTVQVSKALKKFKSKVKPLKVLQPF